MPSTKRSFKRPFQPSVSSCFGYSARDSGSTHDAQISTPISALPITIQCSLLNVGMRVRKSVSEGYQTQRDLSRGLTNAYCSFAPERDSVALSHDVTGPIPCCGIRISCLNPQPAPSEDDLPPLQFDADDWGLPSSQESKAFSDSTQPLVNVPVASSHKRRCEYEDDELDGESEPASPRSYPPFSHTRMPNLNQLRPIAMPKTRKKPALGPTELMESEMIDAGSFGEAEFFRPDKWEKDWAHANKT